MKQKLLGWSLVSVPFIALLVGLWLTYGWKTVGTLVIVCDGGIVIAVCMLVGLTLLDSGLDKAP
jgi:hypothetical protein